MSSQSNPPQSAQAPFEQTRCIGHVDMNAFFASVEIFDRPELAGRPVVVGGRTSRSVVAAASYEARRFGVGSAMPMQQARSLCRDLVIVAPNMDRYRTVSALVMDCLSTFTPHVEQLSIDEAFLELTARQRTSTSREALAMDIHAAVLGASGLECSVGIAPNKFLAKRCSEAAKPRVDGRREQAANTSCESSPATFVLRQRDVAGFLDPLSVRQLWGVGAKTGAQLLEIGLVTIGDVRTCPPGVLIDALGERMAARVTELAHGIDDSPVTTDRQAKSMSRNRTFSVDYYQHDELHGELLSMCDDVTSRLRAGNLRAKTVTLTLRYADFRTVTRSVTHRSVFDDVSTMFVSIRNLLEREDLSDGIRLVGAGVSNFIEADSGCQLDLFETNDTQRGIPTAPIGTEDSRIDDVLDDIRTKFGSSAITFGRLVETETNDDNVNRSVVPPRKNNAKK